MLADFFFTYKYIASFVIDHFVVKHDTKVEKNEHFLFSGWCWKSLIEHKQYYKDSQKIGLSEIVLIFFKFITLHFYFFLSLHSFSPVFFSVFIVHFYLLCTTYLI